MSVCQIDGGSENANKYMLAVCELLVLKRLCKRVVLTRLPPGHTHEDIDALFAKIWKAIRGDAVLTPEQYKKMIEEAVSKRNKVAQVKDVFVVPNLSEYFEEFIDQEIKNYTKMDDAKLQFTFDAVPPSADYPGGVKVTYRYFSAEKVIEIKEGEGPNFPLGFQAIQTTVLNHPDPTLGEAPFTTFRMLPTPRTEFKAVPFIQGARAKIEKVAAATCAKVPLEDVARGWASFLSEYPENDDVGNRITLFYSNQP